MIDDETRAKIIRLSQVDKWLVTTIGNEIGVHHGTVKRVLHEAGLSPVSRTRKPRLVDPYLPFIQEKLKAYPDLCASRLYGMVKDLGYGGRPDHFRSLVACLRPRKQAEAYLRLKTLPGEQAQVDWGHFGTLRIGQATRRLSAFVMVLSYSRQVFLQFYLGQALSLFLRGHQEAFAFFGGVPRVLLYDNLKSVVLERQGPAIRFNPQLVSFSAHQRYEPRPVAVCRGNEKGRVERAIKYIRTAFFAGREVVDLATLNRQALDFCLGEAGDRRHPEDRTMTVRLAWERDKERLLPLPEVPYPVEECVPVCVGKTPYARFDKNDYSVPYDRVGRTLQIRATPDEVRILDGDEGVATHNRSWDQGQQVEDPAHIKTLVERKQQARLHRGMSYLCHLVPQAQELLCRLGERGENLGSATAALMRLLGHYGPEQMQAAVAEAVLGGTAHPHAVRHILEQRCRAARLAPPMEVALPKDSPLRQVSVVPHALSTYDSLNQETGHDDDLDLSDIF
jgi:transposase